MENNKTNNPNLITVDDVPKGRPDLRIVKPAPEMIEMPDSVREGISIPVREMGSAATSVVVSHDSDRVVSRPISEGRFGNPPVQVNKSEGVPMEFPGHDAYSLQPRTVVDTTGNKERPTEIDPEV